MTAQGSLNNGAAEDMQYGNLDDMPGGADGADGSQETIISYNQ